MRHTRRSSASKPVRLSMRSQPPVDEYENEADSSSDTAETRISRAFMNDLPVNAPPSFEAHQRRPRAGAETSPATISPASSSAISVAQTGTPRTKFDVPSIGSMIQRRSWDPVDPSISPCSSPRTTSRVRVDLSWRRIDVLDGLVGLGHVRHVRLGRNRQVDGAKTVHGEVVGVVGQDVRKSHVVTPRMRHGGYVSPRARTSIVDTFNGLPLHVLVVHAAVIVTPVAALAALALVRPSWRDTSSLARCHRLGGGLAAGLARPRQR